MNEEDPLADYLKCLLRDQPSPSAAPVPEKEPDWTEREFEVQPFFLGKLRLAAPGSQLLGTFALEDEIVSKPGQPSWALGRIKVAGGEFWAATPARLVLPDSGLGPYRWALLPRRSELALLCHGVEARACWQPQQVRWRTERLSRPWLLGMCLEPPCPLIDLERLVEELQR
ncbi:hypothetical protein JCM13664_13950 [Methylothermus subterraneus]